MCVLTWRHFVAILCQSAPALPSLAQTWHLWRKTLFGFPGGTTYLAMCAEPCCEILTASCLQMPFPEGHLEPQTVTWITPFPYSLAMCSLSCNTQICLCQGLKGRGRVF